MAGTLEPIYLAPDKAAPKPTTQNRPVKEVPVTTTPKGLRAGMVLSRHWQSHRDSSGPKLNSRSAFRSYLPREN